MPTTRRSSPRPRWPGWPTSSTAIRDGFDMPVGERGESLSGGQRQSVGIARARAAQRADPAARRADQRDGLLDRSARSRSADRPFAQNKTVVLVTHRTSLLAMVDRVIVIDGGKVVADGPRERIMEALAERPHREGRMMERRSTSTRSCSQAGRVRARWSASAAHGAVMEPIRSCSAADAAPLGSGAEDDRTGGHSQLRARGRRRDVAQPARSARRRSCARRSASSCC